MKILFKGEIKDVEAIYALDLIKRGLAEKVSDIPKDEIIKKRVKK